MVHRFNKLGKLGCTALGRMLKKFNSNFWLVKKFGEIGPWKKSFSRKDELTLLQRVRKTLIAGWKASA
jgi:hypothetical protein